MRMGGEARLKMLLEKLRAACENEVAVCQS